MLITPIESHSEIRGNIFAGLLWEIFLGDFLFSVVHSGVFLYF